jgi:hypothetical protein
MWKPQFMAPEIFEDGGFDFKVDVSGFIVLTGLNPFSNVRNGSSSGAGSPAIPDSVGRPSAEVIGRCRAIASDDRLPFTKIVWAAPPREEHFRAGLDVDRSRATRPAPARRSSCRRLCRRPRSRRSCATTGRAAQPAGGRQRCEFAGAVGSETRGGDCVRRSGQGRPGTADRRRPEPEGGGRHLPAGRGRRRRLAAASSANCSSSARASRKTSRGRPRLQALVGPRLARADVQCRRHRKQVPQGRPEAVRIHKLAAENAFLAFRELWRPRRRRPPRTGGSSTALSSRPTCSSPGLGLSGWKPSWRWRRAGSTRPPSATPGLHSRRAGAAPPPGGGRGMV